MSWADWVRGLFRSKPIYGWGHGTAQLEGLAELRRDGGPRPAALGAWVNVRSVQSGDADLGYAVGWAKAGIRALVALNFAAGGTPSSRQAFVLQVSAEVVRDLPGAPEDEQRAEVVRRLEARGYRWADRDILSGSLDAQLDLIARAIAGSGIWLRIPEIGGFSGHLWSSPEGFCAAWVYMVERIRAIAPDARFVLHGPPKRDEWWLWWPGLDYVDAVGISFYDITQGAVRRYVLAADFAAGRGVPLEISESAPVGEEFRPLGTNDPAVWERWFLVWAEFIRRYRVEVAYYTSYDWTKGAAEYAIWPDTSIPGSLVREQFYDLVRRRFRTL